MDYAQLIIIAILVEAIWENLKMIWDKNKLNINMLGSLLLSLLTGIIVSRGANFVNDLFKKLKGE